MMCHLANENSVDDGGTTVSMRFAEQTASYLHFDTDTFTCHGIHFFKEIVLCSFSPCSSRPVLYYMLFWSVQLQIALQMTAR